MQLLARRDDQQFYLSRVTRPDEFDAPPGKGPYACLLWASTPTAPDAQGAVAQRLLDSECGYFVAGGLQCEQWHDMVDETFVSLDLSPGEYERRFIMTTWHTDGSMRDVAEFLVYSVFPAPGAHREAFERYLVVAYGAPGTEADALGSAVLAALAQYASDSTEP